MIYLEYWPSPEVLLVIHIVHPDNYTMHRSRDWRLNGGIEKTAVKGVKKTPIIFELDDKQRYSGDGS